MDNQNSNFTEEQLIHGILSGDAKAFTYLFDHYAGALLSCIKRIVPDESLAPDILQHVFVKIYKKIACYDAAKGKLFTWMLNITKNECIDVLRSKAYVFKKKTIQLDSLLYKEISNPYRKLDTLEIKRAVYTLAPDLRTLIELSFYYGFPHEEIAILMQLPLGTVKTKIRRAYQQLRERIDK